MSVHVECVDGEIVSSELQRFEDLRQGQLLPITEDNNVLKLCVQYVFDGFIVNTYVGIALHLVFDETKQVLLVHAARVVDVRVDLTNVVEISVRYSLCIPISVNSAKAASRTFMSAISSNSFNRLYIVNLLDRYFRRR